MIDIYLLEHLDALARFGTLRRAAEELHITEPALSRSMKKLEAAFGVPLFFREKNRIFLNETGKYAAECAKKALDANREVLEKTLAFDRSRHMIVIGSCAPYPIRVLLPVLQDCFAGVTLAAEVAEEDMLLTGLQDSRYQFIVLPQKPENDQVVSMNFLDERLYITIPENHPWALRDSISFQDLDGSRLLVSGSAGFWLKICKSKLPNASLLIQSDADALAKLADASSLPAFNSDRMLKGGYIVPGRTAVPIIDPEAHVQYYLTCMKSNKAKLDRLLTLS